MVQTSLPECLSGKTLFRKLELLKIFFRKIAKIEKFQTSSGRRILYGIFAALGIAVVAGSI